MEKQHKISIWTAILININIMIGTGIFFGPSMMAQKAGYASYLSWPIVALIFLPVVLSIAMIARIFPGAGSFYVYAKNLINPTMGFVNGWLYFLGYIGVSALQTVLLRNIILNIVSKGLGISIAPVWFNVIFITLVTLASFLSIKIVGRIQNIGTILKLMPLLFVLAVFLFYLNPSLTLVSSEISQLPSVLPVALFGFWGFECCCAISHLIEGKKSNASNAILIAFFIITVVYTLFHFGLLNIMGPENLVKYGSQGVVNFMTLPVQIKAIISFFFELAVALVFVVSIFSMFTTNSSTLYALASENLLPFSKHIKKLNKNHRPWVAILIQGVITFLIVSVTASKYALLSMVNLGILAAFFITLVALFLLQKSKKQYAHILLTLLAFASCAIFAYFSWFDMGKTHATRFLAMVPLLGAFVAGLCMYFYQKRKNKLMGVK
ncbi:APC family permease [Candidatus Dependentiae bacterium]